MRDARLRLGLLVLVVAAYSCNGQPGDGSAPQVDLQTQRLVTASGWQSGGAWPADTVVALNSLHLRKDSHVTGDMAVIQAGTGPFLAGRSEAVLASGIELHGNLRANSVVLRGGAHVFGSVSYNTLKNAGVIDGAKDTPLALPLAVSVPAVPNFSAGSASVTVRSGSQQTLAAGSYKDIRVREGKSVLTLSGGVYALNSLTLDERARVECSAACELRIQGRLITGSRSYIGPSGTSGLTMSAVQVLVNGSNAGNSPERAPLAAEIGSSAELKGFIFVPNGTLALRAKSNSIGKFIAKDVDAGHDADLRDGTGVVVLPSPWINGQRWPLPALTALTSVDLNHGAQVKGDLAVITAATPGRRLLLPSYEVSLGVAAVVTGNVSGDSVLIRPGARVTGSVRYNNLTNQGTVGTTSSPLALPLEIPTPAFPEFSAGTSSVEVSGKSERALAEGRYGSIELRAGTASKRAVLTLSGGVYEVADIELGAHASIECAAECELRVKQGIDAGPNSSIGPKAGSGLDMSDVRLFVAGEDGGDKGHGKRPYAVELGPNGSLSAFVFVPNGTLQLGAASAARGRLIAQAIALGASVEVEAAGTVIIPPRITAQPASVTVRDGQEASFSVTATGSTLNYQWRRDGVDIPGATSASYTQAPASIADDGARFSVLVSNTADSVTSETALLTVTPVAPVITTHPVSVTVTEGEAASFSCAADGSAPIYQWQKDGVDLSGATATTLTLASVQASDAGSYTCVAENAAGSATSHAAELIVELRAPTLNVQPTDQRVTEGQTASFSVVALGTSLQYQWRKQGQPIAGATDATLVLSDVAYTAAGSYDCVVRNSGGSVTSSAANLIVELVVPVITQGPSAVSALEGESAAFSCTATGTLLSYQWQKDALDIVGANGALFTIPAVSVQDAGDYRCVVSNSAGLVVSSAATLSVRLRPPSISEQPAPQTVFERQAASFRCVASGTSLSYQWQKNGTDIAGANTTTFAIESVRYEDAGDYRCVVSNTGGVATSEAATLQVKLLPPEITQSPSALSVDENAAASFSCAASGTLVQYQWQKDGADIAGATESSYSLAHVVVEDGGSYRCVASNSGGSATSAAAALTVNRLPPVITTQPTSRSATEHTATSFSCAASGTGLSFHWQKDGADIAGSSGDSYSIADVQASHAGQYACVATNSGGSATSQPATLTVQLLPPVITTQPEPISVIEKQSAGFSCEASGTAVSYRWQKNGADLAGAVGADLTLTNVQHTDAGDYRCVASNSGGSVNSQAAGLTVQLLPPQVVGGPSSLSVTEYEPASFSCTASGTLISYAWLKNDVVIAGASGQTYSIARTLETDEGEYRCRVTNSAGSATSEPATLDVQALPPVITQQPSSREVLEHAAVSFSCEASGTGVSYRWQKDGVDIAGATAASFSLADVSYQAAGAYRCIATNESGSATSDAASLTVKLIAPAITLHPVSLTVSEREPASFTCAASGSLVSYRWQKAGADIGGASEATYSIPETQYEDRGDYRCVASNSSGSATSQAATLSVQLLAPTLAAGPLSQRVYEHETVSFQCLGEGTLLSYQWQKDGVDLPGATDSELTLVGVTPLDAGAYVCVVQNTGGSVVSQAATLAVDLLPPSFPTQPSSVTVTEGEAFSLTCTASGTALSFQWSKDGAPLEAATSAVYAVDAADISHAGQYTCTAQNSGGTATSADIPVVVLLKPPVITAQPSDATINEGQAFSFSVTAQGTQLSYQWQRNGADIPGATGTSYTRAASTLSDDGASYRVTVSNSGGTAQSRDAVVHVNDASAPTLSLNGESAVTVTDNTFTITGSAVDTGSGVQEVLIRNDRLPGQEFGVVLDSAGAFTGEVPLSLGDNTVSVVVRDAQGNETTKTVVITVQATELPQITIQEPANGATVQTDTIRVSGRVRSTLSGSDIKLQLGSDVQFPSGTGPDYTFSFEHVRLTPGPNQLSVLAETSRGNTQAVLTVHYGSITPPPSTPVPPVIALQNGTPEVYLVTDAIVVAGSVQAQRCVQKIEVNGVAISFVGSGTVATFNTALSFAAAGSDDVTVQVKATDCDAQVNTAGFIAHRDNGPPVIYVNQLQPAPAINEVLQTPYRLTGTVSDSALAGLTISEQSIIAKPTGTPGQWTFSADVPLQRQLDWPLTIEAWDAAGQRTRQEVVLRLGTNLKLEILSPLDGTQLLVSGTSPVQLAVTARAIGMLSGDAVFAQVDEGARVALQRSGNAASGVVLLAATAGVYTLGVSVESAAGAMLAQGSVQVELKDESSLPVAVVRQEPAADSGNIEANAPIVLHFNRAIDPGQLELAVRETAHGKIFSEPAQGADLTQLSVVNLIEVDRSREPVPGEAQNFPENRMVSFYPSRDYAYGGTVFVDVTYQGAELWHAKFDVRPLPTLIHGFVANQALIPLQGIEVLLTDNGRSAQSNDDGNWNFGFGDPAEQRIPPGRYRALVNPGRKNARFGTLERFIEIGEGLGYAGTFVLPELNSAEPFRHVVSGQTTAATLAHGDVTLDVSQAALRFPDGLPEGDVHAQFLSASQLGHTSVSGARPDWAFGVQPSGIEVEGSLTVSIELPKVDRSYAYVDKLPERVLLVGLDAKSLQIAPVGVAKLDRSAHRIQSVGVLHLQRLDYLGVSSVGGTPALLEAYAGEQIGLSELIAGVEAP